MLTNYSLCDERGNYWHDSSCNGNFINPGRAVFALERCDNLVWRAFQYFQNSRGGQEGGSPGEQGAGGVRETGEERAICYCLLPVKETTPITFLDFHLTFSEA